MNASQFVRRVLIVVAIVAATILILLFIGSSISVILLGVAAVLVTVFFDGIARLIYPRLPLSMGWCRVIAVVAFLIVLGGIGWALAPYVTAQADQLSKQLPSSLQEVEQQVRMLPWGEQIIGYVQNKDVMEEISGNAQKFFSALFGIFGVLGSLYVIIFMGILILASPQAYVDGILHLVPRDRRDRVNEVLNILGETLRSWLTGKLLSMLIVAVFTWIGLWIVGIPLALILGIIAGLLAFVPNFGPLAALLFGVLIAATQGPDKMLWTAAVYTIVQVIESNLITPVIQQRQVSLPMALILFAQLVLGVYTGVLGLVLATPVFAIIMVLIKTFYVEDVLGDHDIMLAPEEKVKERQEVSGWMAESAVGWGSKNIYLAARLVFNKIFSRFESCSIYVIYLPNLMLP